MRPPKATIRLVGSAIGNMRRSRKRSSSPPLAPGRSRRRTRPAVRQSSIGKPRPRRWRTSASPFGGAYPRPNRRTASSPTPRSARYARARVPPAPASSDWKNAAAAALTATRGSPRGRPPPSSSGTGRPKRDATRRTASGNGCDSIRITKANTSPCSPQPKQWKKPRSSLTVNDGVFSAWNGQSPTKLRPRRRSATTSETTSTRLARSRMVRMASSRIRPAMPALTPGGCPRPGSPGRWG